ncbi:hypothetical protein [Parendozoicomonas sp. Alg238-R29]|uniref:hypothetical protein n=1 Tax=Parendozoicomonas sp. Alg238-R29 TaxID=2993446 RepID=UPI00248E5C15|nr:hypothetical protein [Parendozoicomonas sp. Alg238-R29]
MVAKREIYDGEELLWCYNNNSVKSSRYTASHVQPFDIDTDASSAERITKALIKECDSIQHMEIVENQQEFLFRRARSMQNKTIVFCPFNDEEQPFCCLLDGHCGDGRILTAAKSNIHALSAYFKWRLQDETENLDSQCHKILNRLKEAGINRIDGNDVSIPSIIDFSIKIGIFNPEKKQGYFPLHWLSMKMKLEQENSVWLSLLTHKIRLSLSRVDFNLDQLISNLKKTGIPNPLKGDKNEWDIYDLISLTGYCGNFIRTKKSSKEAMDSYIKNPCITTIRQVHIMAKFRSADAIKAIVERRILHGSRNRFSVIVKTFTNSGITIPVDGQFVEATADNLSAFIRHYFKEEEALKMLPFEKLSEDEISTTILENNNERMGYIMAARRDIKETEDPKEKSRKLKGFLKKLVESKIDKKSVPEMLRAALRGFEDIEGVNEPYTFDTVTNLFKEDEDISWLKTIFSVRLADNNELIELLSSNHKPGGHLTREAIKRLKENRELLPRIIITLKEKSCDPKFFHMLARRLNRHEIFNEDGNLWTTEELKLTYNTHVSSPESKVLTYTELSDDDWIEAHSKKGNKLPKEFGKFFLDNIRNEQDPDKKLDYIRRYFRISHRFSDKEKAYSLLSKLRKIDIPEFTQPYTGHTLKDLYKDYPDDEVWLKKFYPIIYSSDDELLDKVKNEWGRKTQEITMELMNRAIHNEELRMKLIVISRAHTKSKASHFYSNIKGQYNRYGFSPPEGETEWNTQNIDIFYQRALKKYGHLAEECKVTEEA